EGGVTYRENLKTQNNIVGTQFFSDIALETVLLPNSAFTIDKSAFENSSCLKIIIIGSATTIIKDSAFEYCLKLISVTIPNSVTEIGESAFGGCTGLTSVTIPSSVTKIGNYAFYGCTAIKEIIIEDGEETLSLGYNRSDKGLFYDCPLGKLYLGRNLTYYTYYGNSPFSGNTSLTELIIGNSVTSIGTYAFRGCSSLTSITIPNSVTSIGNYVFNGCTTLKEISFEDGTETLNLGYNYYTDSRGVTGKGLFYDCPLEKLYLGRNLSYETSSSYGYSPFYGNTNLTELTISNSVTSIGDYAFSGCSGLTSVNITDIASWCNISFGYYSANPLYCAHNLYLNGEKVENLVIPDNVTSIGNRAFGGCSVLISVTIPNSVTSIGSSAFDKCSGLTSVTIPNSVTSIGSYTFDGCSGLTSVTIPNSVTSIGNGAFRSCSGLTSVVIPNSVNSINDYTFEGCSSLTSVTIPNTVTSIGSSAFQGCSGLVFVTIPNSVTSIGWCAFEECSGMTSATIGKSVTTIGKEAFSGCSALESVNIPEGIELLPEKVFYGTALTEVCLPASIKSIGECCFGNTPTITKVVSLNTTPPEIKSSTFDSEVEAAATLYIPKGSLVHYWLDPVWKEFVNMSDDILCLDVIPDATYGDPEIDLAQFAPEGIELVYETSNSDVIEINGTMMRIVGAGEATVGAMLADGGSQMQLMGQMRQFKVNKADLSVTVADITIAQGQKLPAFNYMVEGLVYDDTVDDIETMPQAICDVNEDSAPGEYAVEFTEGSDRNYEITTKPAKVTVTAVEPPASNIDDIDADNDDEIEVYDMKGILLYKGLRSDARLAKGLYLVRQGGAVAKVYVE
ncbi:MAG: leucine-rich repeat protein, partial [Muribaculaceae bacterium]|nr:leucine-rich repeat protein [Muribaculaceae bacterium]